MEKSSFFNKLSSIVIAIFEAAILLTSGITAYHTEHRSKGNFYFSLHRVLYEQSNDSRIRHLKADREGLRPLEFRDI
jgi:hypothetical protein